MPPTYPAATNVFVASHEATSNMVVDFSRNVDDFAVNSYAQIRPVDKMTGYWLEMTVEVAGRILNPNGADLEWADGASDNEDNEGTESHEYLPYLAHRYRSGFNLGRLTTEQASWDIVAQHSRIHSQRMMTWRTQKAIGELTNTANWPTAHTSDVTAIPGATGRWDASTVAAQDIKRSLDYGAEQIHLSTLAAVSPEDLVLVMSPGCARKIAISQEFTDHVTQSEDAWRWIRGRMPGGTPQQGQSYEVPEILYGYRVIIEKTVKVTSRKGATKVTDYVLDDTTPFLAARPGALVADIPAEAPTFATCTQFMYTEMQVETLDDENNKRTRGRVVENYDTRITAPISGFLFTNAVAP